MLIVLPIYPFILFVKLLIHLNYSLAYCFPKYISESNATSLGFYFIFLFNSSHWNYKKINVNKRQMLKQNKLTRVQKS